MAKEIELAAPGFQQIPVQIRVRRILRERVTRIVDGLVDDGEILLNDFYRRRIELPAPALQRTLQVGDRRVVFRVVEAGRHHVGMDGVSARRLADLKVGTTSG